MTGNLAGEQFAGESLWSLWSPGPMTAGVPCAACGERQPTLRVALPQSISAALLRARTLSGRERAVFECLGQGYDNRSIARTMNISERTVKRHVTVILTKLRLESRLQAGLAALIISSVSGRRAEWPEGRMAAD